MKFSYIFPMSCIEFQKSSEVFFVLYLNRSFREGFFSKGSFFWDPSESAPLDTCRGGPIFVWGREGGF